jgi:hypothetical protein
MRSSPPRSSPFTSSACSTSKTAGSRRLGSGTSRRSTSHRRTPRRSSPSACSRRSTRTSSGRSSSAAALSYGVPRETCGASARALSNLATATAKGGDPERAAPMLREAVALSRELGDSERLAYALRRSRRRPPAARSRRGRGTSRRRRAPHPDRGRASRRPARLVLLEGRRCPGHARRAVVYGRVAGGTGTDARRGRRVCRDRVTGAHVYTM